MASRGVIIPTPGQIWFIDQPRLGNSDHGHFVLLTYVNSTHTKVSVNFIATDSTSFGDYRIDSEEAEFRTTGLLHSSHLLRDVTYDIPMAALPRGKYCGFISGEMRKQIEEWWGAKL